MDLDQLNAETFAAHQGEVFRIEPPAGGSPGIELELVEVTDKSTGPAEEVFSLLFRGPPSPALPQRTYGMLHADLGAFPLFLVPVGPGVDGLPLYEAAFNRLKQP